MIKIMLLSLLVSLFSTPLGGMALPLDVEDDILGFAPGYFHVTKNGLNDKRFLWPNKTMVYSFDNDYPESMRTLFQQAMEHISQRTCIKFRERTTEQDYVEVWNGRGCSSFVGRMGNDQKMSLRIDGCAHKGVMIHEIMHSLGYHHEQSRPDRDDYVTILWENVIPGTEHNFAKLPETHVSSYNVSYDYSSILHYSPYAFSKNGKPTIEPTDPDAVIGQLEGMSEGDVKKLVNMYDCDM